ncbi:glycoside hydrolase family 25 protein [Actinomadura yumaensis]|uniref:Glycoside hydrolase family 25 protein n=1 Tax=Actinomadura yumaensis TaxID=111807 RepID=A0ABW2CX23_9ACTN
MPVYGVDVASYQGEPNWSKVRGAGIRFAFSKVTESTDYVNPTWPHNRSGMLGLGGGFLPGAYHFLHGGNGAAQARYFLSKAGDVSGLMVALDVEASGANAATARDWVREFKDRTGGHPVIGYFPRWYWERTGEPDLTFFDSVWQSHYVSGTGSPSSLYAKVPSSWWAPFGGEAISILQYSSSATVSGISGRCDVNAYRRTLDDLRALALGEDDMPLSGEDLNKIRDIVWNTDTAPRPAGSAEGNETWRHVNILRDTYSSVQQVKAAVGALAARMPEGDGEAVAAAVLARLAPDRIAAAIPDHLAEQVRDALAERLATPED